MSGFANFNGQGAIYLCETGTGDAVLNGGIVAETQGNLNSFLPATVQITPADLTVLSQKLTLTFSPNVGRTNLTGIVGVKFAMAASATYNMIGFRNGGATPFTGNHTVYLYDFSNLGAGPLRQATINCDPFSSAIQYVYAPIAPITLTSGASYFLGAAVTNGDPISWGDQRATTLAAVVTPASIVAYYLDSVGAPVAGSAGMQYHGVDLNKIDVYGALVVGQSDQTLAGAGTVASGGTALTGNLVTSYTPGPDRSDFTGAVGASFTPTISMTFNRIGLRCGHGANYIQQVAIGEANGSNWLATVSIDLTGHALNEWVWAVIPTITLNVGQRYVLWSEVFGNGTYFWSDGGTPNAVVMRDCSTYASAYGFNIHDVEHTGVGPGTMYVGLDLASAVLAGGVTGVLNLAQANQGLSASGGPTAGATLALTQAPHSLVAAGKVAVSGALNASQSQALNGVAKATVGGALSASQADQTLAGAGSVALAGVTGALSLAQAPQALVGVATGPTSKYGRGKYGVGKYSRYSVSGINGALNQTQTQTLVAVGSVPYVGTLVVTQADQVLAGIARSTVGASLNAAQAPQTLSGAAGLVATGSLGLSQAAQTILASGAVKVTGTLSATQQPQTLVGAGAAASPDCIGTLRLNQADQAVNGHATVAGTVGALSVTQADQALNGHAGPILTGALNQLLDDQHLDAKGNLGASGKLNLSQSDQSLSATGRVPYVGRLNVAQDPHTLIGAAGAKIGGTLALPQDPQTLAGSVGLSIAARLSLSQANQTLAGACGVTASATLTELQDSQILVGAAKLTVGAALDLTQASQTLTGLLSIAAGGKLNLVQDSHLLDGAVITAIAGRLVAFQQPQTLIAHDQPGTAIQTQARVMVMA